MRFLILVSNSGGHIIPGLTFGNYLKSMGHSITYLASIGKTSKKLLKDDVKWLLTKSFNFKSLSEIKEVSSIVKEYDVIVGFGGYVSLIGSIASIIKRKPLFIFEANSTLGDANIVASKYARKVFTLFPYDKNKFRTIGSPNSDDMNECELRPTISKVLLLGGSQGSTPLYEKYLEFVKDHKKIEFTMSLGSFGEVKEKPRNLNLVKFVDRTSYSNYDLVISRAGGATIGELLKMKIPMVLIPSGYVKHNHQLKNAIKLYEDIKVPYVLDDDELVLELNHALYKLESLKSRKDMVTKYKTYRFEEVCKTAYNMIIEDLKDD